MPPETPPPEMPPPEPSGLPDPGAVRWVAARNDPDGMPQYWVVLDLPETRMAALNKGNVPVVAVCPNPNIAKHIAMVHNAWLANLTGGLRANSYE